MAPLKTPCSIVNLMIFLGWTECVTAIRGFHYLAEWGQVQSSSCCSTPFPAVSSNTPAVFPSHSFPSDLFLIHPHGHSQKLKSVMSKCIYLFPLIRDLTFSSHSKEGESQRKARQQAGVDSSCCNHFQGPSVPAFYVLSLLLVLYGEFSQHRCTGWKALPCALGHGDGFSALKAVS